MQLCFSSYSSGLYVPAGKVVTLTCLGSHDGWQARIGCHTDTLFHLPKWQRWPQVSCTANLTSPSTTIASPYGGLLYFEAVGGACVSTDIMVTGACRAPVFDSTRMSEEDWLLCRSHPAPWGELAGKHVILSLPSTILRALEHPREVTDYWDGVVVSHCELKAVCPPSRRERLVVDVQISAGYMHSGYPVGCTDFLCFLYCCFGTFCKNLR